MLAAKPLRQLPNAWLLLGIAALGCGPTEIPDARRRLLQSWGDSFLLPTYSRFQSQAADLAADTKAYCASPDTGAVSQLQTGWERTRAPYKQAEVFAFGPLKEFPWRLGPRIDFWPARPDTVEKLIELGGDFNGAEIGAAGKGFAAIEWLLYGSPSETTLQKNEARCRYLTAITQDLAVAAEELHSAWHPSGDNYLRELTQAGRSSDAYDSLQMSLGEVVNRMGFLVENIRSEKLGKPLGSGKSTADPTKTESQFSGRALQDILDNLLGLERLYFGHDGGLGLRDYLARQGANFDEPMHHHLDQARKAIALVPPPLTVALVESPERIVAVNSRLSELQRLIQIDIVGALSLTLVFNDNDGD